MKSSPIYLGIALLAMCVSAVMWHFQVLDVIGGGTFGVAIIALYRSWHDYKEGK